LALFIVKNSKKIEILKEKLIIEEKRQKELRNSPRKSLWVTEPNPDPSTEYESRNTVKGFRRSQTINK
jgi:hypothetical protein